MGLCHSHAPDGPVARQLQSSVAGRCHTDALHCIYAFLRLKELLPALQSCHQWRAAGIKEPSRQLLLRLPRNVFVPSVGLGALVAVVASQLRHHVVEIVCPSYTWLRLSQLETLRALPRLTALDATLDLENADLMARLQSAGDSREQCAQLIRAALPPRLRSLTLNCMSSPGTAQALVDALSLLTDLRFLHLVMTATGMEATPVMLAPRYRANIDRSSWPEDAAMGPSGPNDLPVLTALQRPPAAMQPAFSRLHSLSIRWVFGFSADQLMGLEDSLSALPQLAHLQLSLFSTHNSASAPLNLRLPSLRSLGLRGMHLSSLGFLQHSPLLEWLRLLRCGISSADDTLRCLQSFAPQLRSLELDRSVRLSDEQEAQLQPPSALLPALSHFIYVWPR